MDFRHYLPQKCQKQEIIKTSSTRLIIRLIEEFLSRKAEQNQITLCESLKEFTRTPFFTPDSKGVGTQHIESQPIKVSSRIIINCDRERHKKTENDKMRYQNALPVSKKVRYQLEKHRHF